MVSFFQVSVNFFADVLFKFEAKMNGHTKRQITLFIGVIETKFENPRKGLEALFKNLFLFFR